MATKRYKFDIKLNGNSANKKKTVTWLRRVEGLEDKSEKLCGLKYKRHKV